jgi:hypothetical protein
MSLDLDTQILNEPQEITTSMADLYGYAVFSDEFQQNLTRINQQQKEEQSHYFDYVFHNLPEDKTEQVFQQVFAAQSEVVVKEDFLQEEDAQMSLFATVGFTLLGGLLAFGVWMMIERIKKRRKIHEDYSNH